MVRQQTVIFPHFWDSDFSYFDGMEYHGFAALVPAGMRYPGGAGGARRVSGLIATRW